MDRPWLQFDSGDVLSGVAAGGVAVYQKITG